MAFGVRVVEVVVQLLLWFLYCLDITDILNFPIVFLLFLVGVLDFGPWRRSGIPRPRY